MIIAINGKIGSGKDTVGEIIRYIISYKKNGGAWKYPTGFKTGVEYTESDWEIKKFAGKLKIVASILSGSPIENFEDQDFKKQSMTSNWNMTYREFLQKIGTDALRDNLHEDVWVNSLFAEYERPSYWEGREEIWGKFPNWIITDLRFPNELKHIKEKGGITIRVTRPNVINDVSHPSETALDDFEFDYELVNDSSIYNLIEKVNTILINKKII